MSAFFTVASKSEAHTLSTELSIDMESITVNASASTALSSAKDWLEARSAEGFDLIFNSTGRPDLAVVGDIVSSSGLYVHNKETNEPVRLPTDAPAARIVDIATLVNKHPAKLAALLSPILHAHVVKPFKLSPVPISFSDLARPVDDITVAQVLVVKTTRPERIRVDPAAQLFDPRKIYLLVGGCSELGVGISVWMFNHGARHIYLTSRRGRKALSTVSKPYLRDINNKGGDARAISCDALRETDMARWSQHGHRQLLRLRYFFLCPGGRNSRQIGFARVQSWRPRTSTQGGERVRSCPMKLRRFMGSITSTLNKSPNFTSSRPIG